MFPPPSELLPHGGSALLIDEVMESAAEATRCRARISTDFAYLKEGKVSRAICLEWLAQSIGAHMALQEEPEKASAAGYVASVPRLEFTGGDFAEGDEVFIEVRPEAVVENAAKFSGQVFAGGVQRARGTLMVVRAG